MDRETLVKSETKARIRSLLNRIFLEKGLKLTDAAYEAQVSYHMLWAFMKDRQVVGARVMAKLAHWIIKQGYTVDDLESK